MLGALSINTTTRRNSLGDLAALRPALQDTATRIAEAAETWQFPNWPKGTRQMTGAMTLADNIVVLRAARVEQVGAPIALYNDPDNRFVAGIIVTPAVNFVEGTVA